MRLVEGLGGDARDVRLHTPVPSQFAPETGLTARPTGTVASRCGCTVQPLHGCAPPRVRSPTTTARPGCCRSYAGSSAAEKVLSPGNTYNASTTSTASDGCAALWTNRSGDSRPEAPAAAVNTCASDEAIFTSGTGTATVRLSRFVTLHGQRRLLGP